MRPYTASGADRVAVCPASAVLPQADEESEAAGRGSAIHAFLEAVPKVGRDAALDAVPDEHRVACESVDLARLPATSDYAHEVAFAYGLVTGLGRELGRGLERSYPATSPTEIVGTADVVGLVGDDAVIVYDYKTGHSKRKPAAESWQLRILALAAARAYGRSEATVVIVRIFDDGSSWFDVAHLDAWALDDVAEDLARLDNGVRRAEALLSGGSVPGVLMGSHCRYCPAKGSCPGRVALVRQVLGETRSPADIIRALTDEEAAKAVSTLAQLKGIVDGIDHALKERAIAHPIPMGDGHVYGLARGKEFLDAEVVERVAAEMLPGQKVVEVVVKKSSTKAAIKRAVKASLGDKPARGAIKATEDAVLKRIADDGGTRLGRAYVRECKPEDIITDPTPQLAPPPDDSEIPF